MTSPDSPAHRLPYGPSTHQYGELRHPGGQARGIVVVIHGGFWRPHRTLHMTVPLATELTHHGWHTWNIEYRRVGQGSWRDTLADCAAAVDHLSVLADEHGLALDRVLVLGHSAGGHLAAWCAGRGAVAQRAGQPAPPVTITGLVTAAGALDLTAGAHAGTGDDAVPQFLGGHPHTVPEHYTAADPTQRLPTGVPTRCVHSRADERVPFAHSQNYVAGASAVGDDIRLHETSGIHTDPITPETPAFKTVINALNEIAP